jgi:transcriptional regulator with XRE-family HTH domain
MGRKARTQQKLDRTLGVICRLRRAAAGLDQSDVAERVGLSQATYSKLENGAIAWNIMHLRAIARALGTTPQAVLEQINDDDELED